LDEDDKDPRPATFGTSPSHLTHHVKKIQCKLGRTRAKH
jgi:hypothetical protein